MNKVIICFSATGNSLYVAKKFEGYQIIRLREKKEIVLPKTIETLGFVFPAHTFNIPYLLRKFIKENLASYDLRSIKYTFAVITCALTGKASASYLSKALQDVGLALSYVETVKMPDAYLDLKKKTYSSEERNKIFSSADEKCGKIIKEIENEEIRLAPHGFVFSLFSRSEGAKPEKNRKLTVNSSLCTLCRACERICPMSNITYCDGKMVMGDNCISCYCCYHNCPCSAFVYKGAEGQYKSPANLEEGYV